MERPRRQVRFWICDKSPMELIRLRENSLATILCDRCQALNIQTGMTPKPQLRRVLVRSGSIRLTHAEVRHLDRKRALNLA